MTEPPPRIAMWSGPRTISTALMRSWGNRPDTFVCDEPLYAHYLFNVPVDHPGRGEVIASQPTDWRQVVAWLTGPVPDGKAIFYQKHMTHHLLPQIDRGWLALVQNCFLIRDPREMLTSLVKHLPHPTLRDTGLPQQVEIFESERARSGRVPPVIDAKDVLSNPRRLLGLLCDAVGVEFTDAMLSWPPGRRPTDGVWARYWYAAVEKSTSFERYVPKTESVPPELTDLCDQSVELYERLWQHRLQ